MLHGGVSAKGGVVNPVGVYPVNLFHFLDEAVYRAADHFLHGIKPVGVVDGVAYAAYDIRTQSGLGIQGRMGGNELGAVHII